MRNNTCFSDVQPFPVCSRGTPGTLDMLNLCIFFLLALYLSF